MPKRKFQETVESGTCGWSGFVDSGVFKEKFLDFVYQMPSTVFNDERVDLSHKFEELIVPSGSELCQSRIDKALKAWTKQKADPANEMTHKEFAKKFNMPSLHKCEKIWEKLRERRKEHAGKQSKLEVNSWTYLRKKYYSHKVKNQYGVSEVAGKKLILFHVCIYNSIYSSQANRLMKEMIFLDSHSLLDLARQIHCLAKAKTSRGFFVINGTIYCDREVDCAAFLKKTRKNFQEDASQEYYRRKPMKTQYISDLRFQIGDPFHFIHGNCEHQIVITNVRISNSQKDCFNLKEYPFPVYEQLKRRQKCCACVDQPATKVTYNDERAITSPCFWCKTCFTSFHYFEDGTKQYEEFEETDYVHD